MLFYSDVEGKVPEHRITGQYRNKSSRIWDPHPQYLIDAFGVHLHLILYQDNEFIPKHLKVITFSSFAMKSFFLSSSLHEMKRPNQSPTNENVLIFSRRSHTFGII